MRFGRMPRRLRGSGALLVIGGALALAGCGSGGGGSGSAGYTIGGTVSGLASSGLVLQNNGADDTEVAGASFAFTTPLADGAAYAVSVKSDPAVEYCTVSNGTGTVQGAAVGNVAVRCEGWRAGQLIENNNNGSASSPQVAVDAGGNAIAVWHQSDGVRNNLWANRYVAGSGWGTPELIEHNDVGAAVYPRIAMTGTGDAFVVWRFIVGGRSDIMGNHYVVGSGWGTEQFIETDNSGSALEPRISVDAAGNGMAIWRQSNGTRYVVYTSGYDPATGWGAPVQIEDSTGSAISPQLAFAPNGDAVVVWSQSDGTRYSIWSNRHTATGWSTPLLLETDDSGDAYNPQVALTSDGEVLAVWQQWDGARYSLFANSYTGAGGWGTAAPIDVGNGGDANDPQLVADGSGNAVAVWSQAEGGVYTIWANRYSSGGGWGTAQKLQTDAPGNAYLPQLAVNGSGDFLTVWSQTDSDTADVGVWTNRYDRVGGWGRARVVDGVQSDYPHLAFGGDGKAVVVWEKQQSTLEPWTGRWDISASRFE